MMLLKYKQRGTKAGEIINVYGIKRYVSHGDIVDYDQQEEVEESKLTQRIKELKSFTNRFYHSFTAIKL